MHPIIGPGAGTAPQPEAGRPAAARCPAPGHTFHLRVFNIKAVHSQGSAGWLAPILLFWGALGPWHVDGAVLSCCPPAVPAPCCPGLMGHPNSPARWMLHSHPSRLLGLMSHCAQAAAVTHVQELGSRLVTHWAPTCHELQLCLTGAASRCQGRWYGDGGIPIL